MKRSNCCDTPPTTEYDADNLGHCSKCGEGAVFNDRMSNDITKQEIAITEGDIELFQDLIEGKIDNITWGDVKFVRYEDMYPEDMQFKSKYDGRGIRRK